MGYGKFNEIRDASPLSLHSLNDMLRYLYNRVQGGITGKDHKIPTFQTIHKV